ncbi:MAG: transcription termination/antitermination protein NusG [Pseudomonadota bacterium]
MSDFNWYIVHVQSGCENKAAVGIKEAIAKKNMQHLVNDVMVPSTNVPTVRRGKKVDVDQKFFPGYVLVNMVMNEEAWHIVRSSPKISGFLGAKGKPKPISKAEYQRIVGQVENNDLVKRAKLSFEVGESINVINGPFDGFNGVIEEVDDPREQVFVTVSILGRATKVKLDYNQVEKL